MIPDEVPHYPSPQQNTSIAGNARVGSVVTFGTVTGDVNFWVATPPSEDELARASRLLEELPLDTIPDRLRLPAARASYSDHKLFVGRADDLRELARVLKSGGTAAIGQTAVASGMGGIGKTQLASEFVHRYGQFFAGGVYWLSFADPAAVPAQVAICGGRTAMDLPDFSGCRWSSGPQRAGGVGESAPAASGAGRLRRPAPAIASGGRTPAAVASW